MSVGSEVALALFLALGIVGFLALLGGYLTIQIALNEAGQKIDKSKLVRCGWRKTCPLCEKGRLFETRLRMYDKCPHCGTRFWQSEGAGLGSIIIEYAAATGAALIVWGICILFGFAGIVQFIAASVAAVVAVVIVAPWSLSFWLAFLYLTGEFKSPSLKPHQGTSTIAGKPRSRLVRFPRPKR
jgi:uncharacterized protein (DUF983 family)